MTADMAIPADVAGREALRALLLSTAVLGVQAPLRRVGLRGGRTSDQRFPVQAGHGLMVRRAIGDPAAGCGIDATTVTAVHEDSMELDVRSTDQDDRGDVVLGTASARLWP